MRLLGVDYGGSSIKLAYLDTGSYRAKFLTVHFAALLQALPAFIIGEMSLDKLEEVYRIKDEAEINGVREKLLNQVSSVIRAAFPVEGAVDAVIATGSKLSGTYLETIANRTVLTKYVFGGYISDGTKVLHYTGERDFAELNELSSRPLTRGDVLTHKLGALAVAERLAEKLGLEDLSVIEMGTLSTAVFPSLQSKWENYEILMLGLFTNVGRLGLGFRLYDHFHLFTNTTTLLIDLLSMLGDHVPEIDEVFKLTLEALTSGIPNLVVGSVKKGDGATLSRELSADTYLERPNRWEVLVVLYRLFKGVEELLRGFVLDSLLSTPHRGELRAALFGYGEYIVDYVLRDSPIERIRASSAIGKKASVYATSLGSLLDYARKNREEVDVYKLKVS